MKPRSRQPAVGLATLSTRRIEPEMIFTRTSIDRPKSATAALLAPRPGLSLLRQLAADEYLPRPPMRHLEIA